MQILAPLLTITGIASIITSLFFATPHLTENLSQSTHTNDLFRTAIILTTAGIITLAVGLTLIALNN